MHPLLERFHSKETVIDVIRRGRRAHPLDHFEQALWQVASREGRVVGVLFESLLPDGDSFSGDSARDILVVEAAAELLRFDARVGGAVAALFQQCGDVALGRELLAVAVSEEAWFRPRLPGQFDHAWVHEAVLALTRVVELGRGGLEGLIAQTVKSFPSRQQRDARRVCEAIVEEWFLDGPSLLSREVVARGLEACGDEIEDPAHERRVAAQLIAVLASAGVVGPARQAWLASVVEVVSLAAA